MGTGPDLLPAGIFDSENLTNTLTPDDDEITIERMFSPPMVEVSTVTDDALSSHIQDCARWRAALDGFEARMLAEFETRQIARGHGFRDSVAWMSSTTPIGETTARTAFERAAILDVLPTFGAALADGQISSDHLTSVIRAAGITGCDALVADETVLVGWARNTNPKCFSRKVRRWVLQQHTDVGDTAAEAAHVARSASVGINTTSGTGFLHAELPVDKHAIVTKALWEIVDEQWRAEKGADTPAPAHTALTSQQRLADALVEMARRATGASTSGAGTNPARPLVTVLIDLDTLTGRLSHTGTPTYTGAPDKSGTPDGCGARLADGTPIDASTARRLACEADLIPVVLGGQSQPLDVGRSRRLATRAQRAAMLTRSATCEWPGCTTPANWCQAHHLTPWETGGQTDLHNLMYACTQHHHQCHEGNWTVTRNNRGTICVTPPTTGTSPTTPPVDTPRSPSIDPPQRGGPRRPRQAARQAHTSTTPSQPPPRRRTRAA